MAASVDVNPVEYFLRTRRAVKAALAEAGVAERIEELVTELLGFV